MAVAKPAISRTRSGSRRHRGTRIGATSAAVGAQPVPGAAQGFDGVPAERLVDLAAQVRDVDVDDVGAQVRFAVPDLVQDVVPGDALSGAGQQQREDVELPGGQLDLAVPAGYPAAGRIQCEIAGP